MSQITYRGNLSTKSFPFLAENFGRSVIVKGPDQNFNRQVTAQEDSDKDIGIPQLYYCHNVMPNPEGFQSVGYTTIISGLNTIVFTQIITLRNAQDNKVYLGVTALGGLYISNGGAWTLKGTYTWSGIVTSAYIDGVTYIYLQGYGCIIYDVPSASFIGVTLTALNITGAEAIIGICGVAGYMLAWSLDSVFWSSTLPIIGYTVDFTPSLVTGAGGGSVQGARGALTICVPHLLGFIVYTTANAVAALYSGNTRFPFNFREIVNSGGLSSMSLIGYDANTGNHYAYTTAGIQLISPSQTQTVFPEITDFIAGKEFEDFDPVTNTFTNTVLTTTMQKQVNIISERYMIISYGIVGLTHAIVYDLAMKRHGKLKINHVDVFEYSLPSSGITEIPRQSIGFLQQDGTVQVIDFSTNNVNHQGVLILGKYQYVRARTLTLDEINLENIRAGANYSLTNLYTLDGKNYISTIPTLTAAQGNFRQYRCRTTGLNHSLVNYGAFVIVSVVLVFNVHGKR